MVWRDIALCHFSSYISYAVSLCSLCRGSINNNKYNFFFCWWLRLVHSQSYFMAFPGKVVFPPSPPETQFTSIKDRALNDLLIYRNSLWRTRLLLSHDFVSAQAIVGDFYFRRSIRISHKATTNQRNELCDGGEGKGLQPIVTVMESKIIFFCSYDNNSAVSNKWFEVISFEKLNFMNSIWHHWLTSLRAILRCYRISI